MIVDKNKGTRHTHPEEPGQWVELVALTGREMDDARNERIDSQLSRFKPYLKDFAELRRAEDDAKAKDEGKDAYDCDKLLTAAIRHWSYDVEVSDATIGQLDNVTREWLWETIYEANRARPLASAST